MKKFLAVILAITTMMSMSIVFAQETASNFVTLMGAERNVLVTKGEISEISEGKVRIAGEGANKEIVLNIQESTYILNGLEGTQIAFADLKQGDAVTAYYGPRMTRSIPPQGNAIALIVGTTEASSAGMYMKVAELEENSDGSIKVLCTNADRLVTIRPDIFPQITDIKEGSELVVWYKMMTMSIPAQATATKVVLLPARASIMVNASVGTVVVNGNKLVLTDDDRIEGSGNTPMLPLRIIAESLGYNVTWDNETKTVELQSGPRIMATMKIGSKTYGQFKMAVQLDYAPKIVNGKTFVPIAFFTDVIKLKVEVNNSEL